MSNRLVFCLSARPNRPWTGRSLLKGRRRATEKALGCYGGDVSRLLDLCRARIVLPNPCAAAECLRAVAAAAAAAAAGHDGDGVCAGVRVLRVRNWAAESAAAAAAASGEAWRGDEWGGGFRVQPLLRCRLCPTAAAVAHGHIIRLCVCYPGIISVWVR